MVDREGIVETTMLSRLAVGLAVLSTIAPNSALAESLPWYDPQKNTWNATHIVVAEGGKVVESWKGDLKAGDPLPEHAARFTRVPVPGPDPWSKLTGEKPPVVSGKRMVLFLAHVPQEGQDPKTLVWMGAH